MLVQRTPCCPISIQTPSFGACPCCKSQYLGSIGDFFGSRMSLETSTFLEVYSYYKFQERSFHSKTLDSYQPQKLRDISKSWILCIDIATMWWRTWQPLTNIDPDSDQTAVRNTSAPCSWVSWFAWPDGTRLFMFMPSIHLTWSCQSLSISRCSVFTQPQTNLNVQLPPSGSAYGSPKLCSLYLLGASWGPAIAQGAVWRLMLPMMLHVPWIWKWMIDEMIENDTMIILDGCTCRWY